MNKKQFTRRAALAGALGMAAGGLLAASESTKTESRSKTREKRETAWPYIPLDPQKCAQRAYDFYIPRGCMYATMKGGVTEYATLLEAENPELASVCRKFPFLALGYGKNGLGGKESLCGAVNGAAMFIGLFVADIAQQGQLIQALCAYVETTELPEFSPANDERPDFPQSVSGSILCHDNKAVWLALVDSEAHRAQRSERCRRYAASILAKAVTLLNGHFSGEENG